MRRFQEAGAQLILWTMRDDGRQLRGLDIPAEITPHDGNAYLTNAVDFCSVNGIEFWAHNINPEQNSWSGSPKAYGHIYIDDAALGCPRIPDSEAQRWMADWSVIGPEVLKRIIEGDELK
jgi:hypothetical protein